jgi:hypothetical protein
MRVCSTAAAAAAARIAAAGVLMAACALGGCANGDRPPTPTTASFDMQPVPKRVKSDGWLSQLFDMVRGHTPIADVKLMENPDSADARRRGIYNLMRRDFGQREPYTRRYRQIAQGDPNATVRAAAIRALNASRDKAAVPVFVAALTDPSEMVRLEAAKALSNVPDPTASEPLMRVLGNQAETRDVRIAASEALRHYRNLDVARVLAGTLGGRDFSIAWQSRWSLKVLTGSDYGYDERAWVDYLTGSTKPLG